MNPPIIRHNNGLYYFDLWNFGLNKDIEADFLPGQLESVRFDDKYYGLPMTWTSYVFMVNEAIINPRSMAGVEELDPRLPYAEAVAVPPPPHMEPATWDEMLEMIEWCRGSAFNRGTHFFIVDWPPTLVWLWQTLALQKGAEIITRDGQVDLHHPAVLDAFDQLHAWRKARRPFLMEWPVPFHTDAPYYERIPTQSDHWFTKICGLDVFRDSSTLDNTRPYSHMAPMPATAGGGDAILADSVDMPVWNYVFLVPNGATDIEQAAWEFADWASTSDVLAATLANEFYPMMPARRSVLDNPLFGLDTNFQRRQALADYPRYVRWPLVPGLTEVRTILEAGFRRAWKDWESADHAAEIFVEVEQEANDAIARARFAASNAQ